MRESRIPELGTPRRRLVARSTFPRTCARPAAAPGVHRNGGMNSLSMIALSLACATLAGCEEDLLADLPDAAVEVDAPPPLEGNFACAGMPWQTTSVDPLRVAGHVAYADTGDGAGNVPVEIRAVDGDVLLAQGITDITYRPWPIRVHANAWHWSVRRP